MDIVLLFRLEDPELVFRRTYGSEIVFSVCGNIVMVVLAYARSKHESERRGRRWGRED
jgi:hypothetical protein